VLRGFKKKAAYLVDLKLLRNQISDGRYVTMKEHTVISIKDRIEISDPFNELLMSDARKRIEQAIEAELQEILVQYTGKRSESGHEALLRNGYLPERAIRTGIGPVTVKVPKIRSRSGLPVTFRFALGEIYPGTRHQRCWMHKTCNVLNALKKYPIQRKRSPARYLAGG